MDYKDFLNLVLERQACRKFDGREIEQDKLEKICRLARLAPSACNSQPSKMYCVTGKEGIKKVAEALQKDGRNKFTSDAGAFIVVSEKGVELMKDVQTVFGTDYFVKYDVGETVAYITLAAKSLGVDSCIIGWVDGDKLKEYLHFDSDESCRLVVALGYSDVPVREKIRKSEKETIVYVK